MCVSTHTANLLKVYLTPKEKQSRAHITEKAEGRPQTVSLLQCFIYRSTFPPCFTALLVLYASFTLLVSCKEKAAEAAAVVICFICAMLDTTATVS